MRGSLCEQPHCCGDQPQSVSLRQIHHSSREHLALMNGATLESPLQVIKTQWTIPVGNTVSAAFFEKVLDFRRLSVFLIQVQIYFLYNLSMLGRSFKDLFTCLLQASVSVLPFALQAEGVEAE